MTTNNQGHIKAVNEIEAYKDAKIEAVHENLMKMRRSNTRERTIVEPWDGAKKQVIEETFMVQKRFI